MSTDQRDVPTTYSGSYFQTMMHFVFFGVRVAHGSHRREASFYRDNMTFVSFFEIVSELEYGGPLRIHWCHLCVLF